MTATAPDVSAGPWEAEALDVGELGDSLGFLLRLSQLEVFGMFYRALSGYGLRPGEFSILYLIYRNPGARQGAIAERLMVKRAHMTKLVRGYEAQGLVRREIPEDNRRAVTLYLTEMGTRFVAESAPGFFAYARTEGSRLSAEEADQLVRLLRKFTGMEVPS